MTATSRGTAFRDALDEHLGALQSRDAVRFASTLGPDAAVVDGAGTLTRGTDAVMRSHADWFDAPEAWSFDYELVLVRETASSGLALLNVTYRHTPDAAPSRFLLSLVFERGADGVFRFVYDQNTPLPSP